MFARRWRLSCGRRGVQAQQPVVSVPPAGQSVLTGSNALLGVTATGAGPLAYRWHRDGQALVTAGRITGADTPALGLAWVAAGDAGYYSVTVANSAGTTTSAEAALSVMAAPWTNADVGAAGRAGLGAVNGGVIRVEGAGADIGGAADAFQFVHAPATGDVEIVARVVSMESTDPGAKAGVMIRESLAAGSKCAFMFSTPASGTLFLRRTAAGGAAVATGTNDWASMPWWLKLTRKGNQLSAASSPDGAVWISLGSDTVVMGASVLAGLGVVSRDTNRTCAAVFESAQVYPFAAPAVGVQPASRTNWAETTAAFSVAASGAPPLRYQWRKNGAVVAGATNAVFQWDNVQPGDAGNYDVVITNGAGSVTSQVAVLTVNTPASVTWNGSVSSDWHNPTNWTPRQVPAATNKVVIGSGTVAVTALSRYAVMSLYGATVTGPLVVRGGTVLYWQGNYSPRTLLGQGSSVLVESNGLITLSGDWMTLGGVMTNQGRVAQKGSYFRVQNDNGNWRGRVVNQGLWDMQADADTSQEWGNDYGVFENNGVFRKSAGGGTGTLNLPFLNTYGTVEVLSGTLRFDHGLRLDGLFLAGPGGTIQLNAGTFEYVVQTRLRGAGQYRLTGGTLQGLNDFLPGLALAGGTVVLSPAYQTNGTIGRLDLIGSTLSGGYRVTGVMNLWASTVAGAVRVAPGGVLNWQGNYSPRTVFGQGSSLVVESNGLVNLTGDWQTMGGPMTNDGRVVQRGSYFRVQNDNGNWQGRVVNRAVWEMQGDYDISQEWANDFGVFDNGGVLQKSAGSGTGSLNLPLLNTQGVLEVQSGVLRLDHGQRLDGLYLAGSGATVQMNSGTFDYLPQTRLSGAGSYRLTGGTLQGLNDYLPALQLVGGALRIAADYQTNGTIARLDLNGTTLLGSNRVTGVLNLWSSTVSGSVGVAAGGVLNWQGNYSPRTLFGQGSILVVESGGLVNVLGDWQTLGGRMLNFGRVVQSGSYFRIQNDAAAWQGGVENMPGGEWEIAGDWDTSQEWSTDFAYFRNAGVLRKSAGTGTAALNVPFYNSGRVEQWAGVLSFGRNFTLTDGVVLFGISASDYGRINLTGTATLAGRLAVGLAGAFVPAPGASYPVMTWGTVAGAFTNTDGLNIGFGRYLTAGYAASGLTLTTWATNRPNTAPSWAAIPSVTIPENVPYSFTNSVGDSEGNQVLFKMLTGPAGATVGLSNGVFRWTPSEAQGPSSNYITLWIGDNGSPSLTATQSFVIRVVESNSAPVLPKVEDQIIGVGGMFALNCGAVDADLPANTVLYTLSTAPSGMSVNGSGVITWTPLQSQAFQTFQVELRAQDNGSPQLSATNRFTVRVMPRSVPPAGLVSWWSGDGTTADNQGLNDGILSGVASYAPGLFGSQAFSFGGGYLSVMHSPSLSLPSTNGLTVEMWVKRSDAGYPVYYFGKQAGCGDYNYRSPSDSYSGGALFDLPLGQWTHLAWVFNGEEMFAYVNGVFTTRLKTTLGSPNLAPLFIGASGSCGNSFRGAIDEARLYNRALGAAEVVSVFNGFPAFYGQPASQGVFAGTPVVLSATASGGEPLKLQWLFNGAPLAGAGATNLVLSNAQPAQAGAYCMVASNAWGAVTSSVATLVVYPGIVQHPVSQSVAPGGTAAFSVAAGTPPPACQWFKDGAPLSDDGRVSGSASLALTVAGAGPLDAGTYWAVLSYAGGSGASRAATLSVVTPAWTNLDVGAVVTPGFAVMSNSMRWVAGAGDDIGNHADAFEFLHTNATGSMEIIARVWSMASTHPSAKAAVMIREDLTPGSRMAALALTPGGTEFLSRDVANTPPWIAYGGDVWQSPVWLKLTRSGNLFLAAKSTDGVTWQGVASASVAMGVSARIGLAVTSHDTNRVCAALFDAVQVYPYEAMPVILQQPVARVSVVGTSVEFNVVPAPTAPLYYQWRLNGAPLSGATASNLVVANIQPPDAGAYTVVISNAAGSVTSTVAALVVNSPVTWNGLVSSDWHNRTNWTPQRVPLASDVVNVNVGNVTATTNSLFAVLNLSAATINGALVVRSNTVLNAYGNYSPRTLFGAGSSLVVENGGAVNWIGDWITLGGGMTNYGRVTQQTTQLRLQNDNSSWKGRVFNWGVWDLAADVDLSQEWSGDYGVFKNDGVFRKSGGAGTASVNLPFWNTNGTVEVLSGTLRFDHGQRLDGLFVAGPGATIQFNSGTFDYLAGTRLTGAGSYRLTGGTLQGLTDFLPSLQLAGGTVVLSPVFQTNGYVSRLDLVGSTLAGNYRVTGALNMWGSTVAGALRIAPNAVLNWQGNYSPRTLFGQNSSLVVESNGLVNLTGDWQTMGGPMTNYGRVVQTGSYFRIQNDNNNWKGRVVNQGVWDMQADADVSQEWSGDYGPFDNNGLFVKSAGTGTGVLNLAFLNTHGTVEARSGVIRFDHGQRLDGLFTAGPAGTIQFASGTFLYLPDTQLAGAGQYRLTGGQLQGLTDYLPNLQLVGGSLILSPVYQTNGTIGRLDLNGSTLLGDYRISGVLNLWSSTVAGAIVTGSNAVLNWQGNYSPRSLFGQGSSLVVETNGLVNLLGDWQTMGGGMTNYGRVVQKGSCFRIQNDNANWKGRVVNVGVWEMQGDSDLSQEWSNDYGPFENDGLFVKTAGSGTGTLNLLFVNTYGTLEVRSGVVRFDHGQRLDGLFLASPASILQFGAGTFDYLPQTRLAGPGRYRLTGGTLQGLNDYLPALELVGGSVRLSGDYQTNGMIARLDLNGSTLLGANRVSGVLNLWSSTVSGALRIAAGGVLNWQGNYSPRTQFGQGSSLVVETNGLVNLLGDWQTLGGGMTNYGRVLQQGSYFRIQNDASGWRGGIENMPGGVWEIQGDWDTSQEWGNDYAFFRNSGVLRKTAGAGTATVNVMYYNQGRIEQSTGILNFGRNFTLTDGTVVFGMAGGDYGRINLAGTATLAGRLAVSLLDAFIPAAGASYPVMTWGVASGTFTNYDGLNVGYGRYFTPSYSSSGLTLLTVATNRGNLAPVWAAIPNFTIPEGARFAYTNDVRDTDGNQVLFKVVSAPAGAGVGLSNGVFSWTPSEAQGPGSNYVTLRIEDSGAPSLMATQSFIIWVVETNTAPVLPQLGMQLIGVGGALNVNYAARDADLPTNTLAYALDQAPAGMQILPGGTVTWTPSAPGTYQARVRVTDNGVPPLSATNTLVVSVLPQPVPPAGLVSWWTADGTTADQTGLNDGVLAGAAGYGSGFYGRQSFWFEGGFMAAMHSASLSVNPTNAMTVEMWVNRTQSGYPVYYFGKQSGCGDYNYRSPSDLYSGGGFFDGPAGEWRHLTWVFSGQELLSYVNGVFQGRVITSLGAENIAPLFLGASGSCGSPFRGYMDEVRLYNRALGSNEIMALYSGQSSGAPVLDYPPASRTILQGGDAVFQVSAHGAAPLSYQWRFNGAPLAGQTESNLVVGAVTPANEGQYDLVVTNVFGAVTSQVARLVVWIAPVVTSQPHGGVFLVGDSVTLSVTASGIPAPAYQWRKNGAWISGATGSSLALTGLQTTDSGAYEALAFSVAGFMFSQPATILVAEPLTWVGGVSSDWNTSANWSPSRVPTASDVANVFTGGVVVPANARFAALNLRGAVLSGTVVVRSNTVFNWYGNYSPRSQTGGGSAVMVEAGGTINLTGDWMTLGGALTNYGRVAQKGSLFRLQNDCAGNSGRVVNFGVWEVQGDYDISQEWGNDCAWFQNNGLFVKTAGSGAAPVNVTFRNTSGAVEARSGTVRFDHSLRLDGVFLAGPGAAVQFASGTFDYLAQTRLTGAGAFQLTGGTLQGLLDFQPNFQFTGGTVILSPSYQTNGTIGRLDLNGSALAGNYRVSGELNLWGSMVSGAIITGSNAVLNWQGNYSPRTRFGPGSSLLVESNGLVNLTGDWQTLGGPMTNYGRVVQKGSYFRVQTDNSSWTGRVVNYGLWEMQGDVDLSQEWGTDLGVFENNGLLVKTSGSGTATLNLPFLNTRGTVEALSGTLRFDHGQRLDGLYVSGPGAVIQFQAGTFEYLAQTRLTGAGLYRLTGGVLQGLNDFLPRLELAGGSVSLSAAYQTNGAVGRLDLIGSTLLGNTRVTGVLNLWGSTVAGSMTVASNGTLNWYGNYSPRTLFGQGAALVVESNGLVNMIGDWQTLGGGMTNYGRVVMTGGYFRIQNDNSNWRGGVVNAGLWEIQGDYDLSQEWNTDYAFFENDGIVRKTAGPGTAVLNTPFFNTRGTVECQSGVLRLDHGLRLDGLFQAGPGAVVQFASGTFDYVPQSRLSGAGQYRLTGGVMQGLNDYLPNLLLSGGTVYLSPDYQTNGVIRRLDVNGAALGGSNRVSGLLNMFGNVNGPLVINPEGVVNFGAGALYGRIVVSSNGLLNIQGNYSPRTLFAGGSLLLVQSNGAVNIVGDWHTLGGVWTNYGRITLAGNYCRLQNDAASWQGGILNMPGGVWEIQGDLDMSQEWANDYAYFRNSGLLRRTVGTGVATVGVMFYNQGQIEQLGGSLNFGRNFSLTDGTVTFGIGAGDFGRINLAGTATLAGRLAVSFLDGYIPPAGASYPVMSWGVVAGTFTNYDGLYTGFGRYLTPVYSAGGLALQTGSTNRPNAAPVWGPIPAFTIPEGVAFRYTNAVSDADADTVLFKLVSGPAGAAVGLSNGVFTWTPSEAQGPSSNWVTLRILDGGSPSQMATQSFVIWVVESNAAPVLPVVGPQVVGIHGVLSVNNTAVDSDAPANTLVYSLISPPAGVSINNGLISWSPGAPGVFQITTKVTDNGVPSLSATNSFTVRVLDKPTPPAGLVSWWTGDGVTTDEMGWHDGVLTGAAGYAPGYYGSQAFSFDGGWMVLSNSPLLSFAPTNEFSLEMWVKRTQAGYPVYYYGKQVDCGSWNYRSPTDQFSAGTLLDPPAGEWRHYAWVYTGHDLVMYVNGVAAYRIEAAAGPENAAALLIGATGTCGQSYRGQMDEVRLYNRALNSNDVANLYGGVNTGALYFKRHPRHQTMMLGGTAAFNTVVVGAEPLSYQWRFKGAPIPNATSNSLSIPGISGVNAGDYTVVVSNAVNTITSQVATLTVRYAPVLPVIPTQLAGVGGWLIVSNGAASGAPAGGLLYSLLAAPAGAAVDSNGVVTWSPLAAQAPGLYPVTTRVVDGQFPALSATNTFMVRALAKPVIPAGLVSWWTGDGTTADQQGLNDGVLTGGANYGPGLYGQAFSFFGGWMVVMHSASLSLPPGSAMTFEMWVKRSAPGYPAGFFGKRAGCGDGNYQFSTAQFSQGGDYDAPAGEWRHFTWVFTSTETLGYVNGVLTHRVLGSLGPENAGPLFVGSLSCGTPLQALVDEVRLYNRALTSNEIMAVYSGQSTPAPMIVQEPAPLLVGVTGTASFQALAYGAPPLAYQWLKNGVAVPGATNTSLVMANVQASQAGGYALAVTNLYGAATSQVAVLTVSATIPVTLVAQPAGVTVTNGAEVRLAVSAAGTAPVFQWRFNGVAMPGQTASNFVLHAAGPAQAGYYDVVVANAVSSVTSAPPALVRVLVVPSAGAPLLSGGALVFGVPTENRLNYSVWTTESLAPPVVWQFLTNTTGSGSPWTVVAPASGSPARFYRVKVE